MSEQVQASLPVIMTRGLRGDLHCTLVFTTSRLIISIKGFLAQAGASGAFGAGGAIGGAIGGALASSGKNEPSLRSPGEILRSNKKNVELQYSNIIKVETGRKLMTDRLYVYAPDQVYRFKFGPATLEQVEDRLRQLLPSNIPIQRVEKLG